MLTVTVLDPFSYGITIEDIRRAAEEIIERPDYFQQDSGTQSRQLALLHYFFKELSASQKYNVLRDEPVAQTIRKEVAVLLERHASDFTPKAVFAPFQARRTPEGLLVDGTTYRLQTKLLHHFFPQEAGEANQPLCFLYVVTVGRSADRIIKEYGQNNQPLEAFVMNSIAAALADTLAECLQFYLEEQYRDQLGSRALHRYSPGYHDWLLSDQAVIFQLLEPQKRIDVTLTEAFLMNPLKSTSGIMGVKYDRPVPKMKDGHHEKPRQ